MCFGNRSSSLHTDRALSDHVIFMQLGLNEADTFLSPVQDWFIHS
jgi:hypothetical protein